MWKTQEIYMKYYYLGTSEKSHSRGYGGGVWPRKFPQGPLQKDFV